MKKLFVLSILLTGFCCSNLSAQSYKTAVGLRLGLPTGLSIKHFLNENSAVEAFAGLGYRNISVGAAYLYHKDLDQVDNLRWYAGAGAGIRKWRSFYYTGSTIGVSGQLYAGLDYKLEDLPINVSFDIVPSLFIGGYRSGIGIWGGFAVRYVLGEGGLNL